MRADEYVVKELLENKEMNAQLIASNSVLRQELNKVEQDFNLVKSLFYVEETSNGNGYRLCVKGLGFCADSSVAYEWTKNEEELSKDFVNLLKALGLELPQETNVDPQQEQVVESENK